MTIPDHEQLEELFEKTAWTLDREYKKEGSEYAASYDCFKRAVDEPQILEALDIAPETREVLLKTIRRRLTPQVTLDKVHVFPCFKLF